MDGVGLRKVGKKQKRNNQHKYLNQHYYEKTLFTFALAGLFSTSSYCSPMKTEDLMATCQAVMQNSKT